MKNQLNEIIKEINHSIEFKYPFDNDNDGCILKFKGIPNAEIGINQNESLLNFHFGLEDFENIDSMQIFIELQFEILESLFRLHDFIFINDDYIIQRDIKIIYEIHLDESPFIEIEIKNKFES